MLPAAQAVKDSEEFKAQAMKQWEDSSIPVVPQGSEFTSLASPQNAMKEAECIRFREHEGQGSGLTARLRLPHGRT